MIRKLLFAMPLVVVLGACGSNTSNDSDDAAGDDASARGEVLGGTISDEMIPLDQLKSRSAPLRRTPNASGTGRSDATPAAEPAEAEAVVQETAPAAEDSAPQLPED